MIVVQLILRKLDQKRENGQKYYVMVKKDFRTQKLFENSLSFENISDTLGNKVLLVVFRPNGTAMK